MSSSEMISSSPLPARGVTGAPLLEVDDLYVEFRTRDSVVNAVNGISYTVAEGETLAILGESGSGKSVSAQAIMGILDSPPAVITGGGILFEGRDMLTMPAEEQRKIRGPGIAMIFQDALSALNPVYSVGFQIGEMFRAHRGMSRKDAKRRAIELMDRVRIPAAAQRTRKPAPKPTPRPVKPVATPEVAEQLLRDGFSLGGKYVTASVMFADIRGFTSLSETQEPTVTIELLNDYFALMFDPITSNQGTVNQMEGDGIMAIFGAPAFHENHREQAVRAALEMIDLLRSFNAQRAVQGRGQIEIGIGIATGPVIAGYTGTQHRATYTCVGDTVNLAARIEDHTKTAGKPILIDRNTREGLSDSIHSESLGEVLFKGKQQSIHIFSVRA